MAVGLAVHSLQPTIHAAKTSTPDTKTAASKSPSNSSMAEVSVARMIAFFCPGFHEAVTHAAVSQF